MTIAVVANDKQWKEINTGINKVNYLRIEAPGNIPTNAGACLFLTDDLEYDLIAISKPVLLNAVTRTLKEMNAPLNVVRINGWNGFLSASTWEVAGPVNEATQQVFAAMGKKVINVSDEPGFVSARIISMIINEAYFALEDKVSSPDEIDTAMKLGTSYPHGPFEWASLIGIEKVFTLLQVLSLGEERYLPASSLKAAATI